MGGLITIAFSYFFGTKNLWSQMLMFTVLSGVLALILFLILMLDHPFKGSIHVEPVAFQELQEVLGPRNVCFHVPKHLVFPLSLVGTEEAFWTVLRR